MTIELKLDHLGFATLYIPSDSDVLMQLHSIKATQFTK